MAKQPFLSLIIPVYNEEKRIKYGLTQIFSFLKNKKFSWELIIVDDGSIDNTVALAKKLTLTIKTVKILNSNHQGKGGALKKGVKSAQGEWLIFFDIDIATPMDEYNNFEKWMGRFDVIIGSRKMKGAHIEVHQPFFREFGGKVFTLLTNTLVTRNISDVTCGFKLFKTKIAKDLFQRSRLADWSFDAEILYLAQKKGVKIKEVPVRWKDDPQTKVNLMKDTIDAFYGLLKIRFNDFQGLYDR